MHVHSAFGDWFPGGREIILPLFVANGVTGVRDMGGDIPVSLAWRNDSPAARRSARAWSWRPMLDGYLPVVRPSLPQHSPGDLGREAVTAVDSRKAQHVDFIKAQSLILDDPISPPPRKRISKACPLSATCRMRCASAKPSR